MKIPSSTTPSSDKYNLLGRKVMQVSLLLLAVVGYSFFLFNEEEYSYDFTEASRRLATDNGKQQRRQLATSSARNGLHPPDTDIANDLFIIKPVVGYATLDSLEDTTLNGPTLLELPIDGHTASSSTSPYLPSNAADGILSTFWRSGKASNSEHLTVDLGIPEHIREVQVTFPESGEMDFEVQLSYDQDDVESWMTLESYTAFTGTSITLTNVPEGAVGRYLRLYFTGGYSSTGGYPPGRYFSVSSVNVWREPRVISSTATNTYCGDSVVTSKDSLLQQHGGTMDTLYENIEFFSAALTPAQADSMRADPCAYAVERNWIVRPRGRTGLRKSQEYQEYQEEEVPQDAVSQGDQHRRLGIPEMRRLETDFCMEYDPDSHETDEFRQCLVVNGTEYMKPGSWGLQRISSRGRLKGKYLWVNEGFGTNTYVLDTGIYSSSMEWVGRNVTYMRHGPSRLETPHICVGDPSDDGQYSNHGTHVASIAAGYTLGVGKMTTIHPVQVIDGATGLGSVASILCGLDKVVQDGIDYVAWTKETSNETLDYWEERKPVLDVRQYKAVINLSVGVDGRSDVLDQAVKNVVDLGYATITAAGDSASGLGGGNSCHFSPTHPDAIRVGALQNGGPYAITIDGKRSMYMEGSGFNDKAPDSNFGECIDIWAPGHEIMGASNTGEYDEVMMSGTSVAAAFVSGSATHFLEEIDGRVANTQTLWAGRVKDKMIRRGEYGLGDLGHGTRKNLGLQTTVSVCITNDDCPGASTCMMDGACGNMEEIWSRKGIPASAFKPSPPPTPKPQRFQVSAPGPVPLETLNAMLGRAGIPVTESPTPAPIERMSVCREVSSNFHVDTNQGWIEINANPSGSGPYTNPNTVAAPRWSNACSKLSGSPGECAWFVTGDQVDPYQEVPHVFVQSISNEWGSGQYFTYDHDAWVANFGTLSNSRATAHGIKVCRNGVEIYSGSVTVFDPSFSTFRGRVTKHIGRHEPMSSTTDWQVYDIIVPYGSSCPENYWSKVVPSGELYYIADENSSSDDLALGKVATQISTFSNNNGMYGASNAVNGNINTFSHTYNPPTSGSWWQVDLGYPVEITSVVIVNRQDCSSCSPERMNDFSIQLIDADGSTVVDEQFVTTAVASDSKGTTYAGWQENKMARFVKLYMPYKNTPAPDGTRGFLHMSAVKVFGNPFVANDQGFAYRICKAADSSSDCETSGDIELTEVCASHYDGDEATLLLQNHNHVFNGERGTNLWNPLYQGKIFDQGDVCTVPMRFPGQPSPLCKEGGDFSSSSGNLVTWEGATSNTVVGNIDNNEWMTYSNIDFGDSPQYSQIMIRYSKDGGTPSGKLEVKLGNGTVIGNFANPSITGSWDTYVEAYISITDSIQGIHDVTFTALDTVQGFMNIDSWALVK